MTGGQKMEYVTLNNGVKMPMLGYGVYQTPPEQTEQCVLDAIHVGYRSIDTAQAYGNDMLWTVDVNISGKCSILAEMRIC